MGWLFAQLWFWLFCSFLVGSAVATVAVHAISPSVEHIVRQARLAARGRGVREVR